MKRSLLTCLIVPLWCSPAFAQGMALPMPPVVALGAGGYVAGKAVKTALFCKRHPMLCTMGALGGIALGGAVISNRAREQSQELLDARKAEAAGTKILPPGFCPPGRYDGLNQAVQRFCKKGVVKGCEPSDPLVVLKAKAIAFEACARARMSREETCFKGGDKGHQKQIGSLWQGYNVCRGMGGQW